MHRLDFLSNPDFFVVDFLHHCHAHITFAVTWKIEVSSSGFHISVHIATVLAKPLPDCLAGLANILFATPGHSTANGIADVLAVAIQLGIQVNFVGGGSGLEGPSSLNIWANWTVLATFLALFFLV